MKKTNAKRTTKNLSSRKKGLLVVAMVLVVVGVGLIARNVIADRSSKALGSNKTVYCTYVDCYLNPGAGKAARTRRVFVVGYGACRETGIRFIVPNANPNLPYKCLLK